MTILDLLMRSRVKIKTLRYFMHTSRGIRSRDLSRQLKEDPGNTNKALKELTKAGIIELRDNYYYAKDVNMLSLLLQVDERN